MGVDGSGLVQVTSGAQSQDSPALSPDGTVLVYGDALDSGSDQGLHEANSDGTGVPSTAWSRSASTR